jgi:hypothetical protein
MRHTSALGYVHEISTPYAARAYLWDFDVDSDLLKVNHRAWLESRVVSAIRAKGGSTWRVWIDGMASRPGSAQHNLLLSQRRAKSVVDFLTSALGGSKVTFSVEWEGEYTAQLLRHPEHKENAGDRAVHVCLQLIETPIPPPPPPPIKPPELKAGADKTFKIRLLGALGGAGNPFAAATKMPTSAKDFLLKLKPGIGPAAENVYFEVLDVTANQHAVYVYSGFGVSYGPSVPGLKGLGVTYAGDWNEFTVPAPHNVDDFEGAARFFQAAVNTGTSWSQNTFCFGGFRSWRHFLVEIKGFNTGRGIGLPAVSETVGKMKIKVRAASFQDIAPTLGR